MRHAMIVTLTLGLSTRRLQQGAGHRAVAGARMCGPTLGGFWPGTRGINVPCTSMTTPSLSLENPVHSTVPAYLHPHPSTVQQHASLLHAQEDCLSDHE